MPSDFIADALPLLKIPEREYTVPLLEWFGEQVLKERREAMAETAYARGYQQRPFSDEDRLYQHFELCRDAGMDVSLKDYSREARAEWDTVVGVDLSSEKRPGNAIFVLSAMPNGLKIPRLTWVGKWTSPETALRIQQVFERFNPKAVAVETNAYQKSIHQWARATGERGLKDPDTGQIVNLTFVYKVRQFITGMNKGDPVTGLAGIDLEFSNLGWVIPMKDLPLERHPPGHRCGSCRWQYEVKFYPHAKTTDLVMAMWFAWETLLRVSSYVKLPARPEKKKLEMPPRVVVDNRTELERMFEDSDRVPE